MRIRIASMASALILATLAGCHRGGKSGLLLSGNIEVVQADIGFKVAGRVLERVVDEGQSVRAGQLIARLESRDLEQQVALRAADEATARAALAEMLAGSRREEIAAAAAQVDQAKSDLARIEADDARNSELFRQGIIPAREYDSTRTAHDGARARVLEAEQRYELVRQGPRPEQIDQARSRHEQAEQALALARTQLSYATLLSPSDGVVLSKNVEPGDYVSPGTPVITVGDLGRVFLRAYVEETDLGRVKLGSSARITADTFPGKRYEGRVTFISSEAEFTPKSVQTRKERVKLVYRIKIDLPNPNGELKPGMPADAEIAAGT